MTSLTLDRIWTAPRTPRTLRVLHFRALLRLARLRRHAYAADLAFARAAHTTHFDRWASLYLRARL
jgi:hypothetical protein